MQADTKLAQDIVGNWVNQGKTTLARGYLDANKKQIDQTAMNQMTQLVDVAALSKESVVLSNTLPGSFVDKQNKLDSMLKNESISDNLYRATSQQINKLESEFKQRTSESHANIESGAYQALNSNPFMKIGDLPAAQQLAIDKVPGLRGKLNKYDRDGKRFNTDADIYNTLASTSPNELAKISDSDFYNNFRSRLSNEDYDAMFTRRAVGLGGNTKGGTNIVSTQDQITRSLRDARILPAEKGQGDPKQQQYAYSVTLEIQKRITAEEARIGAKNGLDLDKTQKLIDDVLIEKINIPGKMWGASEVSPYSLSKQQQQVINQMNAQGVELTLENISKAMSQAGVK
jgi:hypothetical protein